MPVPSNPPLTPLGSALAGALGAVVSNAVVYPLDTVKTRLQALPDEALVPPPASPLLPAHITSQDASTTLKRARKIPSKLLRGIRRWKMVAMLLRIIKTEGLTGTFKGFPANMLNTFSQQFAYFFFHSWIRNAALRSSASGPSLSTASELLLGAAAGALAQIFTIPVSVVATRQQLWSPSSPSTKGGTEEKELSLFETAREIVEESGPTGLWTGLRPGLVLTVNPAITYGAFERIKSYVMSRRGGEGLSMSENFWIGVISKAIATVVTYPYIFAKVRLQAKQAKAAAGTPETRPANTAAKSDSAPGDISYAQAASEPPSASAPIVSGPEGGSAPSARPASSKSDRGAISLLRAVYRQKGFAGWYQGLTAQIIKAVLCQGILFVSKDQFERSAWVILTLLTRLRARLPLLRA